MTRPASVDPIELALLELARSGFGTVLGGQMLPASGLGRVGRAPTPELAALLEGLYREQFPGLVRYATLQLREEGAAEDVVQRAFEKVWQRSPDPAELDNAAAYVTTATRNEIMRELRRVIVDRNATASETAEETAAPTDVADQIGQRMAVREALSRLAPREREAVVLRMQWQLSIDETASIMGLSAGAVKSYTHHGLRKLREQLAAA